jgi:hypothetical protein
MRYWNAVSPSVGQRTGQGQSVGMQVRDMPHAGPYRLQRRSVFGRPRVLSSTQIARILAWHDSQVTLKQLAASLGVSPATVARIIQTRGSHYKQAPPEERAASLEAHRAQRRDLRDRHWM